MSESQKCSGQISPRHPNEYRIIEFASHIRIPKFNYQTALSTSLPRSATALNHTQSYIDRQAGSTTFTNPSPRSRRTVAAILPCASSGHPPTHPHQTAHHVQSLQPFPRRSRRVRIIPNQIPGFNPPRPPQHAVSHDDTITIDTTAYQPRPAHIPRPAKPHTWAV